MGNYRTNQEIYKDNFGGINANATVLKIGNKEAESIVNWDISDRGSIKVRGGIVSSTNNPGASSIRTREVLSLTRFLTSDYAENYVALANSDNAVGYTVWEASTPTGTWTERYGSKLMADAGIPIVQGWIGKALIANGVNQPLILDPGTNADTIENASLVPPPDSCTVVVTGAAGGSVAQFYCVTSVTGRGESISSPTGQNANGLTIGKSAISATDYNTISWIPKTGCSSQRIYSRSGSTGATSLWRLVGEVSPTTSSFVDNTVNYLDIAGRAWYAPQVTSAWNTPNDWNLNGPPKGFAIVAKGTDERLFAWRGNTVWASALRDPLNWFSQNDAFAFLVTGGEDNNVTGIASLNDYVIIFSRSNAFVYTGASSSTISLQKIIPIGCLNHNSICYAKGDVFFWSEYGPTSFARVMAGADIQPTLAFNGRVQPIAYEQTNTSRWDRITAHSDVKNSRIVWSLASDTATDHDIAIVYQYDSDGFTTYAQWGIGYAVVNNDFSINAVNLFDKIVTINSTTADDGEYINAVYKTPHYDMQSYSPKKRVPYIDVLTNVELGNYTVSVGWGFDFGRYNATPIVLTGTTTDGSTIETTSATTNEHRVYLDGVGKTFQMTFTSNSNLGSEIIGWRPAVVFKGQR